MAYVQAHESRFEGECLHGLGPVVGLGSGFGVVPPCLPSLTLMWSPFCMYTNLYRTPLPFHVHVREGHSSPSPRL